MNADVYRWVCVIVEIIINMGTTLYIYRGRYRWKLWIIVPILLVQVIYGAMNGEYAIVSGWSRFCIYMIDMVVGLLMIKPGLIMRSWILITLYKVFYNVGGPVLYLAVIIPYRWLSGSPSTTWFAEPGMTMAELVIYNVLKVVTAALFSWLTVKIAGKIDALRNDLIVPLFTICFVPMFLGSIVDCFTYTEEAGKYPMVTEVIYGLMMGSILLGLMGLALAVLRRAYVENRLLTLRIAEETAYYQCIRDIQQELRELRHDLHQYLQADSEKTLARVPEYIGNIKAQLKELNGNG